MNELSKYMSIYNQSDLNVLNDLDDTVYGRIGYYQCLGISDNLEESCVQEMLDPENCTEITKEQCCAIMAVRLRDAEMVFPHRASGKFFMSEFDGNYSTHYEVEGHYIVYIKL